MNLANYLPQDRLRAVAAGESLPEYTTGAALFADISGFTALTERVVKKIGARRGMEEISRQINTVYDTLIDEIERQGGSVINFAGDAITCWFDGKQDGSIRATNAALTMQTAMEEFPALGLKIAIASGSAQRFLVGDPQLHYIDALAGEAITRTANGEHLAQNGEVLVDQTTLQALKSAVEVIDWREAQGEKFGVVKGQSSEASNQYSFTGEQLAAELLKPYILPAVYEREISGRGSFLTEFRPCTVLFLRFSGLDYEAENAHTQLDVFIRQVQDIVARHDGVLLQLVIGDKGSYVYINFGALNAHEDDSRRALKTALELQVGTSLELQIGISQGVMRVGAYGGKTRRTYGALGDDVNLAARLMSAASPGEILVSGHVYKATQSDFSFMPRNPLNIKGKSDPLPIFALTGERKQRAMRLQEPTYSLPMVGREQELEIINQKLDLALGGQSQVVGIIAEAGMGKSRLVAEVIRSARNKGFIGYGGACQSDGIQTPYLVWKSIWQAFFEIDHDMPLRKQIRWLESELEDRTPNRIQSLPLLGPVLDVPLPENDFTRSLEPKIRQSTLHALLEDCLKSAAVETPLLIVLEDLHWMDALSAVLLDELARALANQPICFLLAYRPPQLERLQPLPIENLPQFSQIRLSELNSVETETVIRAKMTQLYPSLGGALPPGLVEALSARAEGNPFYLEELLNYLRDRGFDPSDESLLENLDLPDNLHALILSRIDQLSEQEKVTLRVASIIGRLFRAGWLIGYYPELGEMSRVRQSLEQLSALDITPLDSPEPELAYLFKHIVTHEVTYESLPFATRARLHEQLARYIEDTYTENPPLEALAYHYGLSENKAKKIAFLRKAGDAARKNYANEAALAYYGQLLNVLDDAIARANCHLERGQVLMLQGNWDEAEEDFRTALSVSAENHATQAKAQLLLGRLSRLRGDYRSAEEWLALAQAAYRALNEKSELAQVLGEIGSVFLRQGTYAQAREPFTEAMNLAHKLQDKASIAQAQHNLGNVALMQGQYAEARQRYQESLDLRREIGDKAGMAGMLNNLGVVTDYQGDYATSKSFQEESLSLRREIGDKAGVAASLTNLALIALAEDNYADAKAMQEESLMLKRQIGDKPGIGTAFSNLGLVAFTQGQYDAAEKLFKESLALHEEIGDHWGMASSNADLGNIALVRREYEHAKALYEKCLAVEREIEDLAGVAASLIRLGMLAFVCKDTQTAQKLFEESLPLCDEMESRSSLASAWLVLGLIALDSDLAVARGYIFDSLRTREEIMERLPMTSSLVGVAGLFLCEGKPGMAAQLLGAVQAEITRLQAVLEPTMADFHAETVSAVRESLGDEKFQSAWEKGTGWSLSETVQRVLTGEGRLD